MSTNRNTIKVIVASIFFMLGLSYASVPLYRIFCQATGLGGTVKESKIVAIPTTSKTRTLKIEFNSDVSSHLPWKFKPLQREIKVDVGKTALAFYNVTNKSDEIITGVSTYNVTPQKAGLYFNKIQCFCFEEQQIKGGESVDMPVFFFIDPEFLDDPTMDSVDTITLSYTFFKANT